MNSFQGGFSLLLSPYVFYQLDDRETECEGSSTVVECLSSDRGVKGSILAGGNALSKTH